MVLFLLALTALAASIFVVAEIVTLPTRERMTSFRRAAAYGRKTAKKGHDVEGSLRERVLAPAMQAIAGVVVRINPKTSAEAVQLKLVAAGLNRRLSLSAFLAAKGIAALSGLVVGFLFGSVSKGPAFGLVAGACLAAVGFIAPDFVLGMKTRSRQERIRADLPDALDLLAVSVEAGLGFDAALARLAEQLSGPLEEEFALTLNEMRIGESRQEALKKLAERTATPEVAAFCRAILQADQFGISLGRILRVQAVDTRHRRQMAAEEKAMKAPVKMLFPTVAFIFPAMFIVILGPAFMNLSKILSF